MSFFSSTTVPPCDGAPICRFSYFVFFREAEEEPKIEEDSHGGHDHSHSHSHGHDHDHHDGDECSAEEGACTHGVLLWLWLLISLVCFGTVSWVGWRLSPRSRFLFSSSPAA